MSSELSVGTTHEVTVCLASQQGSYLSLREIEKFCEAMRRAGAEGSHSITVEQHHGGVDILTATVDQVRRPIDQRPDRDPT